MSWQAEMVGPTSGGENYSGTGVTGSQQQASDKLPKVITNGHQKDRESNLKTGETAAMSTKQRKNPVSRCCGKVSSFIIGKMENGFFKLGKMIGNHPVIAMGVSGLVAALCCIGLMEFYQENRGEKLWIPEGAKSLEHQTWVEDKFPSSSRRMGIIFESVDDNILTSKYIKTILQVHKDVTLIGNGTKNDWEAMCFRQGPFCFMSGLLEIWGYNETTIQGLSDVDILNAVNNPNLKSPITGRPIYITRHIGGIVKTSGKINKAKASTAAYFIKRQDVFDKSAGAKVDKAADDYEKAFGKVMKKSYSGLKLFYFTQTSYREAAGNSISNDIQLLSVGYILIIVYLAIMLGNFTRLKHKIWLALGGVLTVGLAIGVSFGLSSGFGVFYGPVHSILPFLILGIGVDDVFVITQSWDTTCASVDSKTPVPMKLAKTMRVAGVAITVTSMTDIIAFLIGATTILPALRSFCIYAGIGILAVFFFTCTFFSACVAVDGFRQVKRRDACCCCLIVSENYQPCGCSKHSYLNLFFERVYAKNIVKLPFKIAVIVITIGLVAAGGYGLSQLEQRFDPDWFLPSDSDAIMHNTVQKKYFPSEGVASAVYVGEIDYFKYQKEIRQLNDRVSKNSRVVQSSLTSWSEGFRTWLKTTKNIHSDVDGEGYVTNSVTFYSFLKSYLNTQGASYRKDLQFLNMSSSNVIKATRISFTHKDVNTSPEEIKALDTIQEDAGKVKLGGFTPFAYSRFYLNWETNKVISVELLRNLILASVCVFIVTLFLIANLWTSLMVFTCVVLTLIDVAGMMHFWGLTVDTVTAVMLILAIGLCVDYAAHIGHAFMIAKTGDRNERIAHALIEIAPAVFNGGFSTFLAFVLLGASGSYVFKTFFKVFFLVVVFGLFHGLLYFPVLLSLIGPKPYSTSSEEDSSKVTTLDEKSQYPADNVEMHYTIEQNGNISPVKSNGSVENSAYHASNEQIDKTPKV